MKIKDEGTKHDGHAFTIEKHYLWSIFCVTCNTPIFPLPSHYKENDAEKACEEFVKTFKGRMIPH